MIHLYTFINEKKIKYNLGMTKFLGGENYG